MNIEYTGRNLHVDDPMREFVEQKLQKMAKFVEEPVEVRVILEVEKHRHIAEIHVTHKLGVLQSLEETDGTLHDAVNLALHKTFEQARRSRKKMVDKRRRSNRADHASPHWPISILERESVGGGEAPRIIESTHLPIKPMTIDEAALELERSEHGFVVFRDASSDRLNVLYRRKDDNYGLIAPDGP